MKRLMGMLGASALSLLIAAGPAAAAPWYSSVPLTGTFSDSAIVVPDAENSYAGSFFDVVPDGGPAWARDGLSLNAGAGELTLSHEVLPNGSVTCTSFGRMGFVDRVDEDQRTWIEELNEEGSAVVDGSIACYTGTNWGRDFEAFFVAYEGSEADPTSQCIEITREETDGIVSYTIAPEFTPDEVLLGVVLEEGSECTADIAHVYNDPGPGGFSQEILGEDVSALFELTFTPSA